MTRSARNPELDWDEKMPNVGGKHVMIAETLNTECLIPSSLSAADEPVEPNEVHAVFAVKIFPRTSLSEALDASPAMPVGNEPQPELARDKRLVGALDSACNRTVTGSTWLSGFLEELPLWKCLN